MESANLGVVLDSSIMIEAERQRLEGVRYRRHAELRSGGRYPLAEIIGEHHDPEAAVARAGDGLPRAECD